MNISGVRGRDTCEQIGLEKIAVVVDDFYDRIQHHPTLAQPFSQVHDWAEHKARLSHFWWVSLGGAPYRQDIYRIAEKHMDEKMGMQPALIDDWLALFQETLRDHLPPDQLEPWLQRASHMGRSLSLMLEFRDAKKRNENFPGRFGTV